MPLFPSPEQLPLLQELSFDLLRKLLSRRASNPLLAKAGPADLVEPLGQILLSDGQVVSFAQSARILQVEVPAHRLLLPGLDFGDRGYQGRMDFFGGEGNDGSVFPDAAFLDIDVGRAEFLFGSVDALSDHFFDVFGVRVVLEQGVEKIGLVLLQLMQILIKGFLYFFP